MGEILDQQLQNANYMKGLACELKPREDLSRPLVGRIQPTVDISRYLAGKQKFANGETFAGSTTVAGAATITTYDVPARKTALITGAYLSVLVTAAVDTFRVALEVRDGSTVIHRLYEREFGALAADVEKSVRFGLRVQLTAGLNLRWRVIDQTGTGDSTEVSAGVDIREYCEGVDKV